MKILATAKQRGSVNALVEPIKELQRRGHTVLIYATGSESEASGFQGVDYRRVEEIDPESELTTGKYDFVLSGLSGHDTLDGRFIRAANKLGIPSIGVNDQNTNYLYRFLDVQGIPSVLALMNSECISTLCNQLSPEMAREAIQRSRVVGWTAFDKYAQIRREFDVAKKQKFLESLRGQGINLDDPIHVHATQNTNPSNDQSFYGYEVKSTEATFRVAADLGLKIVTKPHPREDGTPTSDLARKFGHIFIPATACQTLPLLQSASSVTAGRSTILTEACLLNINSGGMVPDISDAELISHPPLYHNAIPFTQSWDGISAVLSLVASTRTEDLDKLAKDRQRFSVDGKASQRLADLVEEVLRA